MGLADTIYARLPVWAQHLAVTAYGVGWYRKRFGPVYDEAVRLFRAQESWDASRRESWVQARLREQLTAAADKVPYYAEAWSEGHKEAAREGRLDALPLLDKHDLRGHETAFLRADLKPRRPLVFHTSGSSGTPIATHWTLDEHRRAIALREARSAAWAGVSFADPRATFSGRLVVPDPHSRGPFHRFNWVEKQVYFSAFHLSGAHAASYVQALHRHATVWTTGYAVSFYLLAEHMLEQGLAPPPSLRAVITTSEKVTAEMRRVMEEAYRCPVFEEYSTVENISFASACENGRLHVSPEAGIVEILRPDGTPCDPGEPGEVVATGLLRAYQPLIRFRLGDEAMWDDAPCPCGRSLPVLKEVIGRLEEVVTGPDGRRLVRFHGIFVDLPAVREGQIVQEALDHIRVKVVPSASWTGDAVTEIQARVRQRLGHGVRVDVERVPHIPRTAAGKFRAVISKIGGRRTGQD